MYPLPIDPFLPEIIGAARSSRSLVLVAEPGAGKTTRVAPALLEAGLLSPSHPGVVLLQPRRVAARASAARIAEERGGVLGAEIGYVIRSDRKVGPRTRLRVVTEGILTRQLLADPFLEGVGAVVLDEFHERSIHTDLALALLREVRDSVRPDLILLVMSATLDAEPISQFLGDAPILRVPGRTFPVSIEYVPTASPSPLPDRAARAVELAIRSPGTDDPGDLLVFLPGAEEIRRTARALAPFAESEGLVVLPLHGSLSAEDQDRALRPAGRRKVVLSTNVAETSLTIDGIRTVIDSGLARFASYDAARGLDRLELGRISRASAAQRAGRAGRTAPGRCLRLWSERETRALAEFDEPDIRRVDLASTLLLLHAWGQSDPSRFGWFEAPPAPQLEAAEALLVLLGAIDPAARSMTPLGHRLIALPTHPRLGRLILAAADVGLAREGAALAALLSEKEILLPPESRPSLPAGSSTRSDLLLRLDLLTAAEHRGFATSVRSIGVDPRAARQVARTRDDLLRAARRFLPAGQGGASSSVETEAELLFSLLLAYPDRVAARRERDPATATLVGGRGLRLDASSVVREAPYFLALDARDERRGRAREARVRLASQIELDWLAQHFPGAYQAETVARFDPERRRVVGFRVLRYRDLTLREEPSQAVDPEAAGLALAAALGADPLAFFRASDEAAQWLDRVAFLRRSMPELELPEATSEALAPLVLDACRGKRAEDDARSGPLVPLLRGLLSHDQDRALQLHAPETLRVPTGNGIRLDYSGDGPPVLAVRLQELFGLAETPRLAGGRIPVLLHLLGPNHRPVQVTQDLRSFWTTTYFQVRKDLRSRYPKHSWPDDPWTARPEARGGRRPPPS
jgi:ATP-dependent helicase HrpB